MGCACRAILASRNRLLSGSHLRSVRLLVRLVVLLRSIRVPLAVLGLLLPFIVLIIALLLFVVALAAFQRLEFLVRV
jgi:hypothetical protein